MNIPNFKDYNPSYAPADEKLSPERAQSLDQLTKLIDGLVSDEELTRPTLLRYLNANKWDVKSAFKALSSTQDWRKEFKVKDLVASDFFTEGETGKIYCNGFSNENNPILYLTPSRQNSNDTAANLRFIVYSVELAICMLPPGVDKLLVVIDLRGYSPRQSSFSSEARQLITIFADHYPERLSRVILLKASWIFSTFFKLASPFIDPVTRNKIFFSSLSKPDASHIHNFVPKQALSKEFGGESEFEYKGPAYFKHAESFFR
ncbi:hypothetical protein DSO57_1002625 [Entomophthora muscae]|uniref:Uncharacterized protein n=1 Tax=Entomophthora muscae TaxID=34485 RepID=A0ACC2SXX8_9FUNG|nr:hypothetical protein DSO57_1002625 [Entomophthora muscae]